MSTAASTLGDSIVNWQRKTYEQLHEIVPRELVEDGSEHAGDKGEGPWVDQREQLIEEILDNVLDIANGMPEGVEDPGVVRMFTRAVQLQRAARSDPDGLDPGWRVRQAARDLK